MFWAFAGLDSRELGQLQNRKTEKGKKIKSWVCNTCLHLDKTFLQIEIVREYRYCNRIHAFRCIQVFSFSVNKNDNRPKTLYIAHRKR